MTTLNLTEDEDKYNAHLSQYANAMNMLGYHYDKNKEVQKALECYKQSYKKGSQIARYNFAGLLSNTPLEDPESESMRYDKCIKLYEKYISACPDDGDGYVAIGDVYGKKCLYNKKREYHIKAFKLGKYNLLSTTIYGGIKESDECTQLLDILFNKIILNHELVDSSIINRLALTYSNGDQGIKKDYQKSVVLWNIAAKKEDLNAIYNLGFSYTYGEGVETNYEKASDLYKKCINAINCSSSQRELGLAYEHGRGVVRDQDKAMEYYILASTNAQKPDSASCIKVVKHLQKTKGIKNKNGCLHYDCETTKLQSKLLLSYIKDNEYTSSQPKDVAIPFNVLCKWKEKLGYKIQKLKKKIEELEMLPPAEGGRLYIEAKDRYTNTISKF
jgi:TPR repeat protein